MISGGIFDVANKESSLENINTRLSDESTWSNLDLSQTLNKEKANLEKFLNLFLSVDEAIKDNLDLLDIAIEESDDASINEINEETLRLLELQKDSMVKFLMKIPKLYYTKSHFPLEISQRAFDHLWRVCESFEMWCKETKQNNLITLNILD